MILFDLGGLQPRPLTSGDKRRLELKAEVEPLFDRLIRDSGLRPIERGV